MNGAITQDTREAVEKSKKPSHEDWAFFESAGAGKRNRTPDLRITNALLYRLSYSGAFVAFV